MYVVGTVPLLHPEAQTVQEMLEGWRNQQLCRNLAHDTVEGRIRLVERFLAYTNEFPWTWTAAMVEKLFSDLRSVQHRQQSTIRDYQNALRLFCSHHIIAAARQRRELTRARAIQALRDLDNDGAPVTFETVAQAADVSRSWLYAQPDIRAQIERLCAAGRRAPATSIPSRQRSSDASLLKRLEVAHERNRKLANENEALRQQLAEVLGQLRVANTHHNASPSPTGNIAAR